MQHEISDRTKCFIFADDDDMPSCGVHLSVCPSVTFVDSVKTNKYIFKFLSRSVSHTILVFPDQMSWQ